MRPRFAIYISILVLVIFAIMFWLRPKHSLTIPALKTESTLVTNTNQLLASNTNVVLKNTSHIIPTNVPISQLGLVTHKVETPEQARQEIESANLPIDFFGLVIDQNSNPIPNVKIKSSVRHWKMPNLNVQLAGSDEIPLEATTGADGRFELTGATGDSFGVLLFKDGYEAESEKNGFGAGSYSYDNPVIFKMWSTNIHEQLITGNKSFDIVPDGRSYFIDLTTDTINESGEGDLKVWVQYTNQPMRGQLYDWSAGIEVINGGLCSSDSYAMYEAPTDGYVPSFLSKQRIKGGQSGEIGDHKFYLLLKNGQEYGRMDINLYAPYGYLSPGLVHISYAINPSGSRILR